MRVLVRRERQHEVVEQRIGRLHREAASAHREDQPLIIAGSGGAPRRTPPALLVVVEPSASCRPARPPVGRARRPRRVSSIPTNMSGATRVRAWTRLDEEGAPVWSRADDALKIMRRKCRATPSSTAKPGRIRRRRSGGTRRPRARRHSARSWRRAASPARARCWRAVERLERLLEPAQRSRRRAAQDYSPAPRRRRIVSRP